MNRKSTGSRRLVAAVSGTLTAIALLATGTAVQADHGLPHPELLGHGTFLDSIGLNVRNKVLGRQTHVVEMQKASELYVLRITIEAGGIAPWHNHHGVGFLVNLGPGVLTNYVGDDCEPRLFFPGDAFIDPGHGDFHAVRNDSDEEIVLIASFVATEGPPVIPATSPDACSHVLD